MTKKNIKINDLLSSGYFLPELRVGLKKQDIEKVLGKKLGPTDIETPDLNSFRIGLESGMQLSILFDKEEMCFKINFDLEENESNNLIFQCDQTIEILNENTSFDKLITILSNLSVEWQFDGRKTYLQTI